MVNVDDRSLQSDLQPKLVGWLGLRVGGHLALSLHSSNEPGELSQWLCKGDFCAVNIDSGIVVAVDVIITFCVRRRRCEMYCGHARLCVCPRPHAHTTARTRM